MKRGVEDCPNDGPAVRGQITIDHQGERRLSVRDAGLHDVDSMSVASTSLKLFCQTDINCASDGSLERDVAHSNLSDE